MVYGLVVVFLGGIFVERTVASIVSLQRLNQSIDTSCVAHPSYCGFGFCGVASMFLFVMLYWLRGAC